METLVTESWRIYARFANQPFLVKPSIPILFFGDSDRYFGSRLKVITLVEHVRRQGLELGVYAEMPQRHLASVIQFDDGVTAAVQDSRCS